MTNVSGRMMWSAALVCLAVAAVGCCPPYSVEVKADPDDAGLRDKMGSLQSIEVNIVGVNETEFSRWAQMSMSKYWQPDDPVRASAIKHVMTFGEGYPNVQTLSKKAEIWNEWKQRQAKYLFVLAYLPWVTTDMPGAADPRRIILPMDWGCWDGAAMGNCDLPIELRADGLTALRQPKADCRKD